MAIDIIGGNGRYGEFARAFDMHGRFNIGATRPFFDEKTGRSYVSVYKGGDPNDKKSWSVVQSNASATLRRDEWKQLDQALITAARYRLGGIEDLVTRGLVFNVGNAMGTTVLEWHDISDGMNAVVTMDGITRGPNDRPVYQYNYLPLPIIHVDYEINARELAASRSMGPSLDVTDAEQAARRIYEQLETMLFTSYTYSYGTKDERNRNTIYGYLNFPDRNTVNLSINWDDSSITGPLIIQDVIEMMQASINDRHYGPWVLYIPTAYQTALAYDFQAGYPKTILQRIKEIEGILDVKVIDTLTANNVLLVEMKPETVRLVRGLDLQNIQWGEEGNLVTKFKVMTIQVPQLRSDQNGRCGIVHLA